MSEPNRLDQIEDKLQQVHTDLEEVKRIIGGGFTSVNAQLSMLQGERTIFHRAMMTANEHSFRSNRKAITACIIAVFALILAVGTYAAG